MSIWIRIQNPYFLFGSGSASVHADPDPGGIFLCGSMRIRIRNTAIQPTVMVVPMMLSSRKILPELVRYRNAKCELLKRFQFKPNRQLVHNNFNKAQTLVLLVAGLALQQRGVEVDPVAGNVDGHAAAVLLPLRHAQNQSKYCFEIGILLRTALMKEGGNFKEILFYL